MAEQLVYVISDLHLGGAPGQKEGERGFRMCTQGAALAGFITELAALPVGGDAPAIELVINGDFVDFLAEEDEPVLWTALKEDPGRARELFLRIVQRNLPVFDALARFAGRGHTLTILIGNHDLELAFPVVRRALAEVLLLKPDVGLRFLHDGEAYAVGDALIEHGNRYDSFNMVDFDKLRRVRSLQSRGQAVPEDLRLVAPPGSQLVAEIMNPLKQHYPFIDLLKPETGAAVPLLLALAPGARRNVAKVASFALKARQHKLRGPALPALPGDIAATGGLGITGPASDPFGAGGPVASDGLLAAGPAADGMAAFGAGPGAFRSGAPDSDEQALREVLREELGDREASRFLDEIADPEATTRRSGDISADGTDPQRGGSFLDKLSSGWAWARLLLIGDDALAEGRLGALHTALRSFCGPELFDLHREPPGSPYYAAAVEMARGPFRHVVMGHTHLARDIELPGGGRYLNTGTWADLMRMPAAVLQAGAAGRSELRALVEALKARRLDDLVWRRPTYARLAIAGGRVREASVEEYRGSHGPL